MAYSINTNIASLQAQEYLRITNDFQYKTINRVTSGLRIVSSGDDAAGLAIANTFRSDRAVLAQGVRNANDGVSTLQTIDGGVNNISQLLDRARSLAAQSASGTFNGDRSLLNSEFQGVLVEIDRQAESIGLNVGGLFAKNLQVFIGGGRGSDPIANGTVDIDLTNATVDTKSLGLTAYHVDGYSDLVSSGRSVADIVNDATNKGAGGTNGGPMKFVFAGAGFSGSNAVTVNVNLSGVADLDSLVEAINNGILQAGFGGTAAALAFKDANVVASVSSDGLSFTLDSSSAAFQVKAGDIMANALLGNFAGAGATGAAATNAYVEAAGAMATAAIAWVDLGAAETQTITFTAADGSGQLQSLDVDLTGAMTRAQAIDAINLALQNSGLAPLQEIVAVASGAASVKFVSASTDFKVTPGVEAANGNGLASQGTTVDAAQSGTGGAVNISTQSTAASAVTLLASSVELLGAAQASVGKGQNRLNFAISLAQTQLTNLAASESRIRDADLAAEAANLTRAQILQQAGIAALAQANAAPQAVLSLLRG